MLTVGYIGGLNFLTPIEKVIDVSLAYEVTSVTRITEVFLNGTQPFETIYSVLGLTSEIYNRDFINNINIIGLKSVQGTDIFYVPESFINGIADATKIDYVEKILAINLGLVPVSLNLDNLLDTLKETVKSSTNLDVEVATMENSGIEKVDAIDHTIYMNKTKYLSARTPTYKELYFALKENYDDLYKIVDNLNGAIKINVIDKTV